MKILHVVQGYTPAIGGTERLIQKVSEKLVEHHGDEVTVYTTTAYNCELFWRTDQPQLPVGSEVINGVRVRRFPVFNRFGWLRGVAADVAYRLRLPYNDWLRTLLNGPIVPGMTAAIASAGAEVVAASSFPLLHMQYALRGGRRGQAGVVLHGGLHPADRFGFDRRMIDQAIRQADAYIANTTFEREYLVGRGIPPHKITVIGVGVDLEPFARAEGRAIRERFGWGDAPVVAYVGQQAPRKGIDLLLEAMTQVWQTHPNTCLLIAGGRTHYSTELRQQVTQMPHARVAIMDNFAEAEKPAIFAACDLLAFPSEYESFGIVLVEAWAAGKPVIGLRVGAVATVIDEGVDGLLVERRNPTKLARAIQTILGRPELGWQMGAAGRLKVHQRYTWDIVAAKFREVYGQVAR
jgi:glycosyltransferase involved in cell wall biosynthesis